MMEEWKDINGFEGCYQISNLGRVKSSKRIVGRGNGFVQNEKILPVFTSIHGYHIRTFVHGKFKKTFPIHRLVAIAFHGFKHGYEVNHLNGIKTDNRVENLEWCTKSENGKHSFAIGLSKPKRGKDHVSSRRIRQLTISGEFIKEWESARQIQRELGYYNSNIIACCKGKKYIKTVHGFKWEYA